MTYTELVDKLSVIRFEPRDPRLDALLCEISAAEDQAGRGMLTAIVVHK